MKTDYFGFMEKQARCSLQAAELLVQIVASFQPDKLSVQKTEMHHIEHSADGIRHDALSKLARDFLPPIEREDLLSLIQILDDVTDALDEVVIDLYMYRIVRLPARATELATAMLNCVRALNAGVAEFPHYKKPQRLTPLLIEVNTRESEADSLFMEAMRELFGTEKDPVRLLGVKAVYESLESCCDLCEHAADVIASVTMNNG